MTFRRPDVSYTKLVVSLLPFLPPPPYLSSPPSCVVGGTSSTKFTLGLENRHSTNPPSLRLLLSKSFPTTRSFSYVVLVRYPLYVNGVSFRPLFPVISLYSTTVPKRQLPLSSRFPFETFVRFYFRLPLPSKVCFCPFLSFPSLLNLHFKLSFSFYLSDSTTPSLNKCLLI